MPEGPKIAITELHAIVPTKDVISMRAKPRHVSVRRESSEIVENKCIYGCKVPYLHVQCKYGHNRSGVKHFFSLALSDAGVCGMSNRFGSVALNIKQAATILLALTLGGLVYVVTADTAVAAKSPRDIYNCGDFDYKEDAQAVLEEDPGDPNRFGRNRGFPHGPHGINGSP